MQATIQNEFLSLTVDTHGAEAVSLKNAAGEELLWQADPAIWKRHAPILFPWTGKLKDGSFTHGGKTYKGGQHGFARDVEHTLLKAEGDTIQLELRPDEAMKAEKFPFDFVLISTFRLDGKTLHHTLTVSNPGAEELLWQADPAVWKRHAPILFPWTGKLPGGTFEVDGKTYKGGQHGFARDVEHTLLKAEGDTIQLELRSDDAIKAERFPFDFVLTSTFRLDGKTVRHTLTVRNPGTEELRFGIGYHPAFNIPFDAQHTTTDYEFRFDQPESPVILDARPNGLLSGKCYYQWKNQQAIQLTDDLFANDSFCMAGLRTKTIGIYEKGTGRKITCNVEGYPYALIWSAPAKPVRFVCIEPWHSLPAAETDPQQWSQRAAAACLAPGESWETTLSTTFER